MLPAAGSRTGDHKTRGDHEAVRLLGHLHHHPTARGHPCGNAHRALTEAGHRPEVVKSYGLAPLPDGVFNRTRGRQEAKRLTGNSQVPVLVTDDGEVIADSVDIVEWARAHPAAGVQA